MTAAQHVAAATDAPRVSIWLTSEGGTHHYGCGANPSASDLLCRFKAAKVATGELGGCCESEDIACAFDIFCDPWDRDPVVILSYALARAEGRADIPPYRCGKCGFLTYGGCCA